ncbi:hypothetical protein B0H19DRAFT_1229746 [Mycena capillaripes]|nr:hypothetical protein B0H19DRAFT_1229746 [Mycena capillaripes]
MALENERYVTFTSVNSSAFYFDAHIHKRALPRGSFFLWTLGLPVYWFLRSEILILGRAADPWRFSDITVAFPILYLSADQSASGFSNFLCPLFSPPQAVVCPNVVQARLRFQRSMQMAGPPSSTSSTALFAAIPEPICSQGRLLFLSSLPMPVVSLIK